MARASGSTTSPATLLDNGGLRRYIDEFSVTGLTSNPTIFDHAIGNTDAYDDGIRDKAKAGQRGEALFVELALEDLRRAADLFRPVIRRAPTESMAGSRWKCRRCSPTTRQAASMRRRGSTSRPTAPNLFVKIPGTPEGVPAIEESIFAGVPINVTLLFSREQYVAAAEAYLRGIERRLAAGLDPRVASVASLFVSRWDKAVSDKVPADLRNRLGIAIAARTYRAYRELLASPRWRTLAGRRRASAAPALGQHRNQGSQGSDTLYIEALAAPDTINTMPEKTLHAFAEHGELKGAMAEDGGDAEAVLARFAQAGIDVAHSRNSCSVTARRRS